MTRCPECDAETLQRSRTQSTFERLRKALTAERPHRCLSCGWRGWNTERNPHQPAAVAPCQPPDFEEIEGVLDGSTASTASTAATPSDDPNEVEVSRK
jgi:hypothetical protein